MSGKFQGPPANDASLDRFLMDNLAIYILTQSHCRLLRWLGVYWPQSLSYRHPRVPSIQVGEFFCAWFHLTPLGKTGMEKYQNTVTFLVRVKSTLHNRFFGIIKSSKVWKFIFSLYLLNANKVNQPKAVKGIPIGLMQIK